MKTTNYTDIRNLTIVVSFNNVGGDMGDKFLPIVIEAKGEAVTEDGAIRNISNKINIGDITDKPLTNEEIYKTVYGVSEILAKALSGVLLEGVNEDMTSVDTSKIASVSLSDVTIREITK